MQATRIATTMGDVQRTTGDTHRALQRSGRRRAAWHAAHCCAAVAMNTALPRNERLNRCRRRRRTSDAGDVVLDEQRDMRARLRLYYIRIHTDTHTPQIQQTPRQRHIGLEGSNHTMRRKRNAKQTTMRTDLSRTHTHACPHAATAAGSDCSDCSGQLATCYVQHATCSLQRATCNMQPATCNMQTVQRAACNVQRGAATAERAKPTQAKRSIAC